MTTDEDLHRGRGWLNNAADVLSGAEDTMSSAEYARIAATLGAGFVALAHAERAAASSATLDAAAERVRRAAAEARPHDDEPPVVYVVEGEETGVLHVAATEELAKAWVADADRGSYLAITATEVSRG